jgi:hypothetical protein
MQAEAEPGLIWTERKRRDYVIKGMEGCRYWDGTINIKGGLVCFETNIEVG